MKSVGLIFLLAVLVMILLTAGGMLLGRWMLHPGDIPVKASLAPDEPKQRFLAFFAHPDDEIAMGGTLIGLSEAGHEIVLVYLTRGEAGPTNGLVPQSELGNTRTNEIQQVGKILGLHALELFDFPDSGLKDVSMDTIKQVAREMIAKHQPDILLSFDSEVGLYGHPDHRAASRALEEVYLEGNGHPGFSPKQYFQLTLSPKQIAIALEISPGFQKNYPKEGRGLPPPDFSVLTTQHFPTLVHMMEAHATQQQVFRDLMPYREELPQFVYSRVFDREYFWEFGKKP